MYAVKASEEILTFLKNPQKYFITELKYIEYTKTFKYGLLDDKKISFSLFVDDTNKVSCSGYCLDQKFIIYNFGSETKNKGYGRVALKWLKNELCYHNISLLVTDITNFAFPFWIKMFDENVIDDVILSSFTLKELNNKEISENENTEYFNRCIDVYKKLDNKYNYCSVMFGISKKIN